MFKKLVNGESVTANERVITPDMVMAPSSQGPSVLLINCHSPSIQSQLASSPIASAISSSVVDTMVDK